MANEFVRLVTGSNISLFALRDSPQRVYSKYRYNSQTIDLPRYINVNRFLRGYQLQHAGIQGDWYQGLRLGNYQPLLFEILQEIPLDIALQILDHYQAEPASCLLAVEALLGPAGMYPDGETVSLLCPVDYKKEPIQTIIKKKKNSNQFVVFHRTEAKPLKPRQHLLAFKYVKELS